ncbi:MAG: carboxylesterase family protein [Rhodospirillaceae bacterium]
MIALRILTLLTLLTLMVLCAGAQSHPVMTDTGYVSGLDEGMARVFKGVPFAAPPVGDLRWRAPQAVNTWTGVKTADRFSPICPQQGLYPPDAPSEPMSEDCLYLNIWTPANPPSTALPVMVWIYGGALTNGSGSTPLYAGDKLVKHDVIVVTFNYRIGVLGFLAHPSLSQESATGTSGNYGLLDQIAALQWVQRNIAAFGGDPENVTVFGQSSGSISISALVTSPLAEGLFQRAIGQSGGLFEPVDLFPNFKLPGAEKEGEDWLDRTGAASIEHLRHKTPNALMTTLFNPHLVIDGYALPRAPYDAYQAGLHNDIDILVGTNADEGAVFLMDEDISLENFEDILADHFSPPVVWVMRPNPGLTGDEARASAVRFEGDLRFRWNMWTWATLASHAGTRKAFFYQFSHQPVFTPDHPYAGHGIPHSVEMPFVFGTLEPFGIPPTSRERDITALVTTYWTNFAKTGDPNGPGLPAWPAYSPARQQVMALNHDPSMIPIPGLDDLQRIDRVYAFGRFFLEYWVALLAGALIVSTGVIAGSILAVRYVFRQRYQRKSIREPN